LKYARSETVLKFIKQKKNAIIGAVVAFAVLILAVLSFNYLGEQKQINSKKAFAEALSSISPENRDDAIEKLRVVSDDYKGTVYATYSLLLIGQALLDKGEYREAAVIFDEALKSKPTVAFLTAQIYGSKAVALEYDNALDEALTSYKKALAIPNNYYRRNEYLLKSALLNLRMGQKDEAKKLFEEIIADSDAGERYLRIAKNELEVLGY
jgi:hypothetical protein